ncbi:hypothetical protein TRFO_21165 [Tritrichomonas foetus]|uniref:non-specific serine/threonine protein kinase n=1 Tax=Tritrichomonas foetus TaxID=1144522 RepID=A0A1J4KKC5_9EUKA|nr:hypothetical protein TRFO_21165 [Tritrichomonas foetus]|eukprot:OHT09805.1 hypothetical protein TRFO_21165 [Tritrichomonas foetus]
MSINLYKSSLSLSKHSPLLATQSLRMGPSNSSRAANILYIFLKGQETILRSILDKIEKETNDDVDSLKNDKNVSAGDEKAQEMAILKKSLIHLLDSHYANLFFNINETISTMQSILSVHDNQYANQILTTAIAMNKTLNSFQMTTSTVSKRRSSNNSNKDPINGNPKNSNQSRSRVSFLDHSNSQQQNGSNQKDASNNKNHSDNSNSENLNNNIQRNNVNSGENIDHTNISNSSNINNSNQNITFNMMNNNNKENNNQNLNNNSYNSSNNSLTNNNAFTNNDSLKNNNAFTNNNASTNNNALTNNNSLANNDSLKNNDSLTNNNLINLSDSGSVSARSGSFDDSDSDDYEDEFVVCRICDEKIPVDKIDEHTKVCADLYRSAAYVSEVNEKLTNMLNEMKMKYLDVSWPGHLNNAVNVCLPVLRCTMAIENIIAVDPGDPDSYDELQSLSQLFNISKSPNPVEFDMQHFKPLVDSKLKASTAIIELNAHYNMRKSIFSVKQPLISDFELIKRISSGAFARVFLARKKSTRDIFAIKVTPKSSLTQKNQVKRILAEKDILLQFSNPHIVSFYYSIIGKNNLYLIMEFLPGGDLYSLLQNIGSMDEETAKIYSFQIVQALKYLREKGIIHRDLKPDNLLIARNGLLKLTDFGLSFMGIINRNGSNSNNQISSSQAQAPTAPRTRSRSNTINTHTHQNNNVDLNNLRSGNNNLTISDSELVQSNSLVGTPDYIAPEIILNRPHSFSADLWSLGVMIYEFVVGEPPFHGKTEKETHENIIRGRYIIDDDLELSPELIDLLSRLLKLNPNERIGAKNIDELINHPWFKDVDINQVPFTPELKSKDDTDYFECRYDLSKDDDKDIIEDMSIVEPTNEHQTSRPISPAASPIGSPMNFNSSFSPLAAPPITLHSSPPSSLNNKPSNLFNSSITSPIGSYGNSLFNNSLGINQFGYSDNSQYDSPMNSPLSSSPNSPPNSTFLQFLNSENVPNFPEYQQPGQLQSFPVTNFANDSNSDTTSIASPNSQNSLLMRSTNTSDPNAPATKGSFDFSSPLAGHKQRVNSEELGVKFESVSIQSLVTSNRRMAEKVRRRRSLSFDVEKRRKTQAPNGKKFCQLYNPNKADEEEIEEEGNNSKLIERDTPACANSSPICNKFIDPNPYK